MNVSKDFFAENINQHSVDDWTLIDDRFCGQLCKMSLSSNDGQKKNYFCYNTESLKSSRIWNDFKFDKM